MQWNNGTIITREQALLRGQTILSAPAQLGDRVRVWFGANSTEERDQSAIGVVVGVHIAGGNLLSWSIAFPIAGSQLYAVVTGITDFIELVTQRIHEGTPLRSANNPAPLPPNVVSLAGRTSSRETPD